MVKKSINPAVAEILHHCTYADGVLKLPPGQIDRQLYQEVDKVLRALGGKWDRKAQGHVFQRDPRDGLEMTVSTGSYVDKKKALGQFWTPPELAERMCAAAGIKPNTTVLEPSAGIGCIVVPALAAGGIVQAVEIDPDVLQQLQTTAAHYPRDRVTCYEADFLRWSQVHPQRVFDAVVMNPPFARNADIAHIRTAYHHLDVGGRLVALSSPHPFFASDRISEVFRDWIKAIGAKVEQVPKGTFAESGTAISTMMIRVVKSRGAGVKAAPAPALPLLGEVA